MPGQAYVGEQYAIDLIQSEGDKDRAKYARSASLIASR